MSAIYSADWRSAIGIKSFLYLVIIKFYRIFAALNITVPLEKTYMMRVSWYQDANRKIIIRIYTIKQAI
jgi:hypothetical protein